MDIQISPLYLTKNLFLFMSIVHVRNNSDSFLVKESIPMHVTCGDKEKKLVISGRATRLLDSAVK